jgi:nucleotide-binding universal stress UspA family protein
MLPIKNILCPTDFSEPSYEALSVANELATHFGAELYLLHVVAPVPQVVANVGPSAFNINTYRMELEKDARTQLDGLIKENISQEILAHSIVTHGNPAERILQITADKDTMDLVVIATHGKSGWRHTLFGSVAERVVRLSPIPVLTISGAKSKK